MFPSEPELHPASVEYRHESHYNNSVLTKSGYNVLVYMLVSKLWMVAPRSCSDH